MAAQVSFIGASLSGPPTEGHAAPRAFAHFDLTRSKSPLPGVLASLQAHQNNWCKSRRHDRKALFQFRI
jgi:hypothetical protein